MLLILAFLIKLRLGGDIISLNCMFLQPSSLVLSDLLQLKHPLRYLTPANFHDVGNRSQHWLVVLREQRYSRPLPSCSSRAADPMDIVYSALREVIVHHCVQS